MQGRLPKLTQILHYHVLSFGMVIDKFHLFVMSVCINITLLLHACSPSSSALFVCAIS
jgi:hypothetical protein